MTPLRHLFGKLFFSAAVVISLNTCTKDHLFDCFASTGTEVTQDRPSGDFVNINLQNNVDLLIRPNSKRYIKVTAGQNLVDGIITELSGNTLYIRNENRCNWVRSFQNKYTVEVGMDKPSLINYYGSGSVSCLDTIRTDEFTFESWNASGNVDLLLNCTKTHLNNNTGRMHLAAHGHSGVSFINYNDVGVCDAQELQTVFTYMKNSSTGDVHVSVDHELGVEITGSGNVYYRGTPATINEVSSGRGKLIRE